MSVAKSSTEGNLCLKRIVAQRLDLCAMGIIRFGHVVFGGYALLSWYKHISQVFRAISMYRIINCSGCVKINHLLDIEQ